MTNDLVSDMLTRIRNASMVVIALLVFVSS
jgi:ribosomal protein S8